jgi:hypothetical protein
MNPLCSASFSYQMPRPRGSGKPRLGERCMQRPYGKISFPYQIFAKIRALRSLILPSSRL